MSFAPKKSSFESICGSPGGLSQPTAGSELHYFELLILDSTLD